MNHIYKRKNLNVDEPICKKTKNDCDLVIDIIENELSQDTIDEIYSKYILKGEQKIYEKDIDIYITHINTNFSDKSLINTPGNYYIMKRMFTKIHENYKSKKLCSFLEGKWMNHIYNNKYLYESNENKWISILKEVEKFIKEHNRLPISEISTLESKLYFWIKKQEKQYYNKHNIPLILSKYIDNISIYDNFYRDQWKQFIITYHKYFITPKSEYKVTNIE